MSDCALSWGWFGSDKWEGVCVCVCVCACVQTEREGMERGGGEVDAGKRVCMQSLQAHLPRGLTLDTYTAGSSTMGSGMPSAVQMAASRGKMRVRVARALGEPLITFQPGTPGRDTLMP